MFLVARLFYLQVIQYDVYNTLSDKNRIQVQSIAPKRGLIFDRNGRLIADNVPSKTLTITKERVDDMEKAIEYVNSVIALSDEQIDSFRRRLDRRRRPFESVPILFRLTEEEIARIEVNRYAMPGVQVEAKLVRHYPLGDLMAHAVGSVRRINETDARRLDPIAYSGTNHIGKIGIEKYYEDVLLGKVGHQRVESDARGRIMEVLDQSLPTPGLDLVLHVDSGLQKVASDALGDKRGTVVAIEPSTGGILALVSKPSYDPNLFVSGIDFKTYAGLRDSVDVPLFNRAVQGQYEPGSTLKPFLALTGLVTGTISAEYTIEDPGWFRLPNNERLYRDWNWQKSGVGSGHGRVDIQKAIYRSCNIYFYQLAVSLGIDRITEHLALFGFGKNLAIDLPEAQSGLLPSKAWKLKTRGQSWYPGDTVNIGIGQGDILVTPLQLATAVAILANRGKAVRPRLLMQSSETQFAGTKLAASGDRTSPILSDIDFIPSQTWDLVIDSMEKVVHRGNRVFGENGTAWAYIGRGIEYRMAGKSGTAQVVEIAQGEEYDEEALDERQRKHAWFIAFAPVENPVIALAVLLENGGGGSKFASPIARKMLDYYILNDRVSAANHE
jgi:penicillin-binding protein 2